MTELNPYLRYIRVTNYLPNKDFVKAYDCRLFYVLSGSGELLTQKESFRLSKGALAYYPAGASYLLSSDARSPLFFITVNFDFTRSYPESVETFRPVARSAFDPSLLRSTHTEIGEELFEKAFVLGNAVFLENDLYSLSELYMKKGRYTDEMCTTLLRFIILKILNYSSDSQRKDTVVSSAVQFINSNYSKDINNKIIASRLGYHPYYLGALFKNETGRTMHKYLFETRLKAGVNMLLGSNLSVGEIAQRCGYQNADHFSASFKRVYKLSPREYKKQNGII